MLSIYVVLNKNYTQYTVLHRITLNFVNGVLCVLGNIVRYVRYTLYKFVNCEQEVN